MNQEQLKADNAALRAEVERLNLRYDNAVEIAETGTKSLVDTIDQPRARVAAMEAQLTSLEADKARLAYVIANGLPKCAFGEEWHYGDYNSAVVYETPEAAIDAARAGKGAP